MKSNSKGRIIKKNTNSEVIEDTIRNKSLYSNTFNNSQPNHCLPNQLSLQSQKQANSRSTCIDNFYKKESAQLPRSAQFTCNKKSNDKEINTSLGLSSTTQMASKRGPNNPALEKTLCTELVKSCKNYFNEDCQINKGIKTSNNIETLLSNDKLTEVNINSIFSVQSIIETEIESSEKPQINAPSKLSLLFEVKQKKIKRDPQRKNKAQKPHDHTQITENFLKENNLINENNVFNMEEFFSIRKAYQ